MYQDNQSKIVFELEVEHLIQHIHVDQDHLFVYTVDENLLVFKLVSKFSGELEHVDSVGLQASNAIENSDVVLVGDATRNAIYFQQRDVTYGLFYHDTGNVVQLDELYRLKNSLSGYVRISNDEASGRLYVIGADRSEILEISSI